MILSEFLEPVSKNPRIRIRKDITLPDDPGCVVYWMQRAQRAYSNQALDSAVEFANRLKLPLAVIFNLVKNYGSSTERHYNFMLNGLRETEESVREMGAAFFICETDGDVHDSVIKSVAALKGAILVSDENPLKIPELWREKTALELPVPFVTVDADVIVPSSLFSREEYSARTLRLKLKPLISLYLEDHRTGKKLIRRWDESSLSYDKNRLMRSVSDTNAWNKLAGENQAGTPPGNSFKGGRKEALALLSSFIKNRLSVYGESRNKPELNGTSRLSPFLHFGQISPAETALAVLNSQSTDSFPESSSFDESRDAFIEELIVRRELAVNYVLRNKNHDSFEGLHEWAKKSLIIHNSDRREYIYTQKQFENAETHDRLWNAAQAEMTGTGFMHGYMRMYWAKKILEWTASPEEAFDTALFLNDRYQLDGRDPNGYTGIAWAIGGKHDRPWGPQRPVFGLIRYMNYNGMKRKFDTEAYISKYQG